MINYYFGHTLLQVFAFFIHIVLYYFTKQDSGQIPNPHFSYIVAALYHIFKVLTKGDIPFAEYAWRGEDQFIFDLQRGHRPMLDTRWHPILIQIMKICWATDPPDRSTFAELEFTFSKMLKK